MNAALLTGGVDLPGSTDSRLIIHRVTIVMRVVMRNVMLLTIEVNFGALVRERLLRKPVRME